MTGRDAIRTALEATRDLAVSYLDDLTDRDILARPVPAANHIAWQVGHLIHAERALVSQELPDAGIAELPPGFSEAHGKGTAGQDDGFLTKAEYVKLFRAGRAATMQSLRELTDRDLDRPTKGRVAASAPTLGAVFLLVSNHTLMHAGQFTVVRRVLGKPVLF